MPLRHHRPERRAGTTDRTRDVRSRLRSGDEGRAHASPTTREVDEHLVVSRLHRGSRVTSPGATRDSVAVKRGRRAG